MVRIRHPAWNRATRDLRRAWTEEGRTRADQTVYAERFVADWRVASGDIATAGAGYDPERAEQRLERLEERMLRQPALEKALYARISERQLGIDDPGMGGGGRDRERDFGMEL